VVRGVLSSILGPLLFLLYVNEMGTLSSIANLIADDTNLFFSGNDVDPLAKSVNFELEKITGHWAKITDWFKANKLSLNIKRHILFYFMLKIRKL